MTLEYFAGAPLAARFDTAALRVLFDRLLIAPRFPVPISQVPVPNFSRRDSGSRPTLFAALSSLTPTKIGCLNFPSAVHSLNFTSSTRRGFTQCAVSFVFGFFSNG